MSEDKPEAVPDSASYANPPIIQRIASVRVDIPPEEFTARIESWGQMVAESFPVANPIVEWVLETDEISVNGGTNIPSFENVVPQVRITPRFERRNDTGKTVMLS